MSGFFGIIMSSLQPAISSKSLTARANASTSSVNVSSTANKRGTLSYNWKRSGKTSTINATASEQTTITGLDTTDGTTTIYCDITDSVTGVTTSTPESIITWTAVVNQNIVISGTVTYNGSTQAYIITGSPALPAPSGTPSTFINAGTYVYPTNITSITPSSDYTLGTVSGSFVINRATISGTAANPSLTYNGVLQSGTVITSVLPSGATFTGSVSASGTAAGTYTSSITGSVNYQGTVNSGTLTISPATLTASTITGSATYTGSAQSVTVLSGINGTYTGLTSVSGTNAGSYTTTITGTGNYTGSVTGTLTISPTTLTASTRTGSATFNGSSQSVTVLSGINGTYTGLTSVSGTNAGYYTTTITGTGNYTGSVTGTLTINAATLTATTTTGSATFNGESQLVTVLSGINGTYSGSTSVSGTNAGSYTTIITGTGNYTGSVTGTLTISPATITLQAPLGYSGVPSTPYNGTTQSMSYTVGGTARNNYSYTITGTSGINAGVYTASITSTTSNYIVSSTYNSFIWYITTPLTASSITGSAVYNGAQKSFTITGINGTYSGSPTVSGTGVEVYTTTIYGSSFYTGSVTGTLIISAATLTASNTTSPHTFYNRASQSFTITGINGTYSGNPTVSGTNAGSYTTTIFGTGNYTGSVRGTLNIYQDVGYVDIFYGGVYDAGYTSGFYVPVRTSNAAFSVTHRISGPGAADAVHFSEGRSGPYSWSQEANPAGAYVRNSNPYTQGWVLTITASITDSNYTFMSAETSVTFNAYVAPPPSSGGGFITE